MLSGSIGGTLVCSSILPARTKHISTMTNNNTIAINYSDEKLRILVEECITQQRSTFTLKGVCSYVLYWAMEYGKANSIYDGYQMSEADNNRVSSILVQIVREGRIAVEAKGEFKKINE